ncbi:MAG: DUF4352 domain-containing protein [Acidobacteriota bacterium]|nr:DUF4352 domain-containing protein [Acidobacteriota bacterium]
MLLKSIPVLLTLGLAACSSTPARKTVVFSAGEKANVEKLTYSVVDTQILPRIGDDTNARTPQNRFFIVQISAFNSGNEDAAIPAMALVDDQGKTYEELTDGAGVPRWLGIIRHVAPNQSESGNIVFDAPAQHYKLKLTDETDANDVYIDVPLNFTHEQMTFGQGGTDALPAGPAPARKK